MFIDNLIKNEKKLLILHRTLNSFQSIEEANILLEIIRKDEKVVTLGIEGDLHTLVDHETGKTVFFFYHGINTKNPRAFDMKSGIKEFLRKKIISTNDISRLNLVTLEKAVIEASEELTLILELKNDFDINQTDLLINTVKSSGRKVIFASCNYIYLSHIKNIDKKCVTLLLAAMASEQNVLTVPFMGGRPFFKKGKYPLVKIMSLSEIRKFTDCLTVIKRGRIADINDYAGNILSEYGIKFLPGNICKSEIGKIFGENSRIVGGFSLECISPISKAYNTYGKLIPSKKQAAK